MIIDKNYGAIHFFQKEILLKLKLVEVHKFFQNQKCVNNHNSCYFMSLVSLQITDIIKE